jgi:NAD(P)-dependent dehydrogenase (short-subunit alcohol dehydrogenase family)
MQIAGRTALVTGAGRGLGLVLVDALLARGATRVYAGVRDPYSLNAAAERFGGRVVPLRLDVTSEHDRQAAAAACPDLDLLVSNAGLAPAGRLLDTPEELVRQTFEVNVFGPLALVRLLAPVLGPRAGGILFVNSLTGLVVSRSSPVYGASKAAARMLALALREQLAQDGVVVTTSHPGFIDTDMASAVPYPKATPQEVAERSLDAWEAERTVVFPDRLAELVEHALHTRVQELLDEPQRVMTSLVAQLRATAD